MFGKPFPVRQQTNQKNHDLAEPAAPSFVFELTPFFCEGA